VRPLKLKALAPVVVQHNDWRKQDDGSWRCGNVLIRCDKVEQFGGYTFRTWYIYRVDPGGKLTKVHPKSRPWGYGRLGGAKIGAARLAEPIEAAS
jgi:hypothetical protein